MKNKDTEDKLICGLTARKYLKCSKEKFESLVKQGLITACRDEYNRWKVSKESVLEYIDNHKPSSKTYFVTDECQYQDVRQYICAAKKSIKIMTADFKRFRLEPTGSQGKDYNDGTPFIEFLMDKAVQGVSVQIICSRPSSSFTEEWNDYYQQMGEPKLFEYMFCIRNHAKLYIVDDKLAYIGSANVTPAGLGQGIFTPGNFEAGILTENKELVLSAKKFFSEIWNNRSCEGCHRADKCED